MLSTGTATRSWALTLTTAAALLALQLCPKQRTEYLPVYAELVCWAIVFIVLEFASRYRIETWEDNDNGFNVPSDLLWVASASIAVAALSSAAGDVTWVAPAVVAILLALRHASFLPRLRKPQPAYLESLWLSLGIGLASVLALAPSDDATRLACGGLALIAFVGLYGSLIHISETSTELLEKPVQSRQGHAIRAIAVRANLLLLVVAVLLTFVLLPGRALDLLDCTWAGILKAIHWLFVLWLVNQAPWEIAPTMWAYTAAVCGTLEPNISTAQDMLQTASQLAVALLNLYQIVSFLPKTTRGRYFLMIFAVWPMLSLRNHITLNNWVSLPYKTVGHPGSNVTQVHPSMRHPIEELHLKARDSLTALVDRQSRTLEAAEIEYNRRYGRPPPPGFDRWFAYAKSKQSILIDDFDMINNDLKPFWNFPVQQLQEGVSHATAVEDLALRRCGFSNREFQGSEEDWLVKDFAQLLFEVSGDLPNVMFAFNIVDEPRVAISQQTLDSGSVAKPNFLDLGHRSIWTRVNNSCQNASSKTARHEVHDYGVPFVQDWFDAKDVCQHPEFEHMHGFFSSPTTALLTDAPIPILSQAAPSSFGDVVYPSPWYTDKVDQGEYKDELDPPWHNKTNVLYWAGSTTGSYSTNQSWTYSHRQRFMELVKTHPKTLHKYMGKIKSGAWGSYRAAEDYSDLYDAKFTAFIQCDEKDCDEQKEHFTLGEKEESNQQYASKFVFDTDGNSFSGRYYTLLQSRSVVLKQTVLREWHDERLIPWLHFVPVSLSMEELPEVMRYLASDENGQRIAKEIADAGREWHARVLRREDFTIYLYRLMLELARVMDLDRLSKHDAMQSDVVGT